MQLLLRIVLGSRFRFVEKCCINSLGLFWRMITYSHYLSESEMIWLILSHLKRLYLMYSYSWNHTFIRSIGVHLISRFHIWKMQLLIVLYHRILKELSLNDNALKNNERYFITFTVSFYIIFVQSNVSTNTSTVQQCSNARTTYNNIHKVW